LKEQSSLEFRSIFCGIVTLQFEDGFGLQPRISESKKPPRDRVEEFKRLALKPSRRRQTVLALSRKAGFASKTSFHNAFKKMIGKTPTQFFKAAKDLNV
jgi:AraC-like DNA-binding protein